MSISYEYSNKKNHIEIEINFQHASGIHYIERFYFNVLSASFLHKNICMITIQPQKHSLGYELEDYYDITIEKTRFLINQIFDCNEDLLIEVSRSEEFRRGLLVVCINESKLQINEFVKQLHKYQSDIERLSIEGVAIGCDPDGRLLYLFNTDFNTDQLRAWEVH